jgi:hypothetical protein
MKLYIAAALLGAVIGWGGAKAIADYGHAREMQWYHDYTSIGAR